MEVGCVKEEMKRYFEAKFKESTLERPRLEHLTTSRLRSEDATVLENSFSKEEIKEVIWEFDDNKSPRLDGYNFNFICKFWHVLEEDICRFVFEFYHRANLSKAVVASFIVLVPKVNNPQLLGEYRQISLVGSLLKFIFKILANRHKKVVGKLVSQSQSAFILGRHIQDSVLVLNKVIDYVKRLKRKCLIQKVDFEKAYDNINWKFLLFMLRKFGFGDRWVKWIKACVCNVSLSVLVNGSPTSEFPMEKGLCQGDPLSPFLFTLIMEGLALLINGVVSTGAFIGFELDVEVNYHLLKFADNTVMLGDPSWANLWSIKAVLRGFELVLGLNINLCKSSLLCFNVDSDFIEASSTFIFCSTGSVPFSFLGVLVGANHRQGISWKPLISMMKNRLSCWKRKHLSIGRRVALINYVLNVIPIYFLSFFKLPKLVLK